MIASDFIESAGVMVTDNSIPLEHFGYSSGISEFALCIALCFLPFLYKNTLSEKIKVSGTVATLVCLFCVWLEMYSFYLPFQSLGAFLFCVWSYKEKDRELFAINSLIFTVPMILWVVV